MVTLTSDMGKLLSAVHELKLRGTIWFSIALSIAQLALKHRSNKNQRQRIIAFVGSNVHEDEKTLIKLAKKLKKNNVAVDVVNFGQIEENKTKLEIFIENAGGEESRCHLVTVPSGPVILSEALGQSPIFVGEDGQSQYIPRNEDFDMGVDPNLDPELALALRLSLEEEKARQEATMKSQGTLEMGEQQAKPGVSSSTPENVVNMSEEDEEALARAIAMSMESGHDAQMEDVSDKKGKDSSKDD